MHNVIHNGVSAVMFNLMIALGPRASAVKQGGPKVIEVKEKILLLSGLDPCHGLSGDVTLAVDSVFDFY